jgi:thiol:disulfide interchange protein DsbD
LLKQFTIIALYTNDRTQLPEEEWITSTIDGRVKNTIGRVNQDFQISRFNTNMLPYYVILDSEGNSLTERGVGFVSKAEFIAHLRRGLQR